MSEGNPDPLELRDPPPATLGETRLVEVVLKGTPGRTPDITPGITRAFEEHVAAGARASAVAAALGINERTFRDWIAEGRAAEQRRAEGKKPRKNDATYIAFTSALTQARGRAEQAMAERIRLAASTDWRAAAFWLERSAPKQWGPRLEVRIAPVRLREAAEQLGVSVEDLQQEMGTSGEMLSSLVESGENEREL